MGLFRVVFHKKTDSLAKGKNIGSTVSALPEPTGGRSFPPAGRRPTLSLPTSGCNRQTSLRGGDHHVPCSCKNTACADRLRAFAARPAGRQRGRGPMGAATASAASLPSGLPLGRPTRLLAQRTRHAAPVSAGHGLARRPLSPAAASAAPPRRSAAATASLLGRPPHTKPLAGPGINQATGTSEQSDLPVAFSPRKGCPKRPRTAWRTVPDREAGQSGRRAAASPAPRNRASRRRRFTPRSLYPTREADRPWSMPAAGSYSSSTSSTNPNRRERQVAWR